MATSTVLVRELNILTVEDNPADLYLLEDMLRTSHLNVANIYSTDRLSEARRLMLSTPVNLVLLDLSLPDSSGIHSFEGIQQLTRKIPVIILTGLSDTNLALEAIQKGAQDYLVKGQFSKNLLLKTIQYSVERKRTIEELWESNERFKAVTKATHDVIWDWDLATDEVYMVGDNYKKLFGYDVGDAVMPPALWQAPIHPEDKDRVIQELHEFIHKGNGSNWEDEYRLQKDDGTYAYVYNRGYLIHDADGKPVRMIGAIQDITERKEAEEKYKQTFYNKPNPALLYDPQTLGILEVNDAALKRYGYSRQEFLSLTINDLCLTEDLPRLHNVLEELNLNPDKIINRKLWRHKKKNGEIIIMETTSYPLDVSGKKLRQVVVNDVTERLRLAKELKEHQKIKERQIAEAVLMAEEKEKTTLGQELHDNINQILTTVKLYLEHIQQYPQSREELISKSLQNVITAINEIRKLTRSLIIGDIAGFELRRSIETILGNIGLINPASFHIEVKGLDEENLTTNLKITILRIVQEQLNNILKYASASTVHIQLTGSGRTIKILIADNGIGFNPEQRRKGVGITNMINRARLYKGKVEIDSAPGKGCRLQVILCR